MKILIVEDEVRLADAIAEIVKEEGFDADIVNDGESGIDFGMSGEYELIVLDVMLPKCSGFEVVKALREEKKDIPILMLTAKSETEDKVTGLDRGADDYMTKPFDSKELLARIRALLRRQGNVVDNTLSYADMVLDLSTRELSRNGRSIRLGYKEFEVLRVLIQNSNQLTSKEDLIIKVWGIDSDVEDNNVEAFISFLRKKFFHLNSNVGIKTVRKVGYQLEVMEE